MRGAVALILVAALSSTGLAACGERTVVPAASASSSDAVPSDAVPSDAGPAPAPAAISREARLEPGPQTGYRFSATGAVIDHRDVTVANAPLLVTVDLRRRVGARPGYYLRIATGDLAGYEVLESSVAYLVGIAGRVPFDPPRSVALAPGGYLAYHFGSGWGLLGTRYAEPPAPTTTTASERAVINGRPYALGASGEWAGWWLPLTRPRRLEAQGLTCEVPGKPPAGGSEVLTRVSTDDPEVALTFDMGGRLDPALKIVRRLIVDRVCATIHPTGATALTPTGTAVMELVATHPELFEVGNHTMHHCNLVLGGEGSSCPPDPPTTAQIQAELTQAQQVIHDLTGLHSAPYWRPPYGAHDAHARSAAAAIGYTKTLMWDVDTIDWKRTLDGGPTAASMQDKVASTATNGSIVLMHLGGYHTFAALPGMVLRLRAEGLTPTTISDLLV